MCERVSSQVFLYQTGGAEFVSVLCTPSASFGATARPSSELDFESGGSAKPEGCEVRLCKTSFMEAPHCLLEDHVSFWLFRTLLGAKGIVCSYILMGHE